MLRGVPADGVGGDGAAAPAQGKAFPFWPSRHIFSHAGLIGFFPAPAVAKWPMERQCARVLTLWPKLVSISETVASGFYEISATGDRLRAM